MQKFIKFNIDTTHDDIRVIEKAIFKGDTLTMQIKVFDNGILADLTNQIVDLILLKSDGTVLEGVQTAVANGIVTATLNEQATLATGLVTGTLQITESATSHISTNIFTYLVLPSIADTVLEKSQDQIQTLQDLLVVINANTTTLNAYETLIQQVAGTTEAVQALADIETYINTNLSDLQNANSSATVNIANETTQNNQATSNISALTTKNSEATTNISNLTTKNSEATSSIATLTTKNSEAVTNNNNLTNTNSTALGLRNALETDILNANNSKSALDISKTNADASKVALDTSINSANSFVNEHGDIIDLDNRVTQNTAQLSEIMINVKGIGFLARGDGVTDDTLAIQTAINTGAGTILIPDGTYMIDGQYLNNADGFGGLSLKSNQKLILSKNAILKAITNSNDVYSIIRIDGVTNVIVEGGTIQGDKYSHTGTTGEWGMGILVRGSKYVTIKDTIAKECWGDGIDLGALSGVASEYITLDNVICDNNRRQGLTIAKAYHIIATKSTFSNTSGTAPQAGIDIEPNSGDGSVYDIKIDKCHIFGNAGMGVESHYCYDINVSNSDIHNNNGGIYALGDSSRKAIINSYNNTFGSNNSHLIPRDYCIIKSENDKFHDVLEDGNGSILFDTTPNSRRIEILNANFERVSLGHCLFWNTSESITEIIMDGCTLKIHGSAPYENYYGNFKSFANNKYILESDYVNTNALSNSLALYFRNSTMIENCKFFNNTSISMKVGGATGVLAVKNCLFTTYFKYDTKDGLSTISEFYQGNILDSYDTTKLPDSFSVGESVSVVNGDTTLPSTLKQGILRTIKPSNSTGYRKFIIQYFYPANSDIATLKDTYFRKGNVVTGTNTNDWSSWIRLNAIRTGTTAQRPTLTNSDVGYQYFDTTLDKPIWWNGTIWKDATATIV